MMEPPTPGDDQAGLDRRTMIRRGAILGGALVWTAPAVQSIAGPAFAAGSPCVPDSVVRINEQCVERTTYNDPPGSPGECCDCYNSIVAAFPAGSPGVSALAVGYCGLVTKQCVATNESC